jgi:NitT/TauT family transport system substrate-binding protein
VIARRTFIAGSAAALGVGVRPAAAQPATALRLASNAADDVTPVLWAQHTGAFAKGGLAVNLTRMNSGAAVAAAVVGGALEIGKSSLMPLITAHAHGVPVSIVAPGELWVSAAPITGLIVRAGSALASPRDLNGKTIATAALNDLSWLATHAWLDAHGGDSRAVKFVELPPAAMLEAVVEGRIDAATITNPNFQAALASGKVKSIGAPSDAIAPRFLLTAWFATNDAIARNGAPIARFAQIVERTAAYTNAHPGETIALLAEFSGIEPAALAHMTRGLCGTGLEARDLQPVIDAASTYHIIDKRFDAREIIAQGSR